MDLIHRKPDTRALSKIHATAAVTVRAPGLRDAARASFVRVFSASRRGDF